MEYVIVAFFFLSVLLVGLGILVAKEEKHKRLLSMVEGYMEHQESPSWFNKMEQMTAKFFPSQLGLEMLDRNLRQAGRPYNWDAHDVTVVRVVASVGLFAVSLAAQTSFNAHVLLGFVFAGVGLSLPYLLIWSAKTQRQAKIQKQLRGFHLMLANLTGTGIRFDQALNEAIKTTTGTFRNILEEMERRMDFRATVPEAFGWLAEETGIKEMDRLAVVVEQAHANGSGMGYALRAMLKEQDEEIANKIERTAQSVNLKVTMTVVFMIVGPSVLFDIIIAGMSFIASYQNF